MKNHESHCMNLIFLAKPPSKTPIGHFPHPRKNKAPSQEMIHRKIPNIVNRY